MGVLLLLLLLNTSEESGRELASCWLRLYYMNARVEKKKNPPIIKLRLMLITRELPSSSYFGWKHSPDMCGTLGRCCNTPGFVSLRLLLVFNISYAISVFFESLPTSSWTCADTPSVVDQTVSVYVGVRYSRDSSQKGSPHDIIVIFKSWYNNIL